MKIIFAKNIGFCLGVKRALEISQKALDEDRGPVHFLGEVIHNEKITDEIKKKGGKFIENPKEAKAGSLVIRAHGIAPFAPVKGVLVRDATCPLVKRAQLAAQTLFKNGYKVIIIGDKNHPEVKGIQGYLKNKAVVIDSQSEAKKLKKFKKIGVVAQTTQSLEKVNQILKILRKKTKDLKWLNTLCPQVLSRQRELSQILKEADGILVIGSSTSANTRRLVDIAKSSKKRVWLANSWKELKKQEFNNVSTLGIVSGTSAPGWEIEKIRKWFNSLK